MQHGAACCNTVQHVATNHQTLRWSMSTAVVQRVRHSRGPRAIRCFGAWSALRTAWHWRLLASGSTPPMRCNVGSVRTVPPSCGTRTSTGRTSAAGATVTWPKPPTNRSPFMPNGQVGALVGATDNRCPPGRATLHRRRRDLPRGLRGWPIHILRRDSWYGRCAAAVCAFTNPFGKGIVGNFLAVILVGHSPIRAGTHLCAPRSLPLLAPVGYAAKAHVTFCADRRTLRCIERVVRCAFAPRAALCRKVHAGCCKLRELFDTAAHCTLSRNFAGSPASVSL